MKKVPEDYLVRQARIERRRRKERMRGSGPRSNLRNVQPLAAVLKRDRFEMPEKCTFAIDSIELCLENFNSMNDRLRAGKRLLLDFSYTKQLSATYAVYFYALVQEFSRSYDEGCVYINLQSLSRHMRFLLRESGLLRLTNRFEVSSEGNNFLPIIFGTKDYKIGEIIDFIIGMAELSGNLTADPVLKARAEQLTSRAISEAMLNVAYHAYPDVNSDEGKVWWFTAVIVNGDLYISLCDQGVGIHNTLPRTEWWEKAMGLLKINDDAQMIQAAMAYTRSSAKNRKGRGLGTKDMQNLVLEQKKGFLTIISGQGHYTLDGAKDGEEKALKIRLPVKGTVINWKIPLGQTK